MPKRRKLNAEDRFAQRRPTADEVLNLAVEDAFEDPVQEVQQSSQVQGSEQVQEDAQVASNRPESAQRFEKTTTGYRRADGTEVKRKTMFFTPKQWKRLQVQAIEAGHGTNISAFVIDALSLDD